MTVELGKKNLSLGEYDRSDPNAFHEILRISAGCKSQDFDPLEGPPNVLSLFMRSELPQLEKERLLEEACYQKEFKQLMKRLILRDIRDFFLVLERLNQFEKAKNIFNWVTLRLASNWPNLVIGYVCELEIKQEKIEKWNFILSLMSLRIKRDVLLYIWSYYGHELFFELFLFIDSVKERRDLLGFVPDENVVDLIEGMMVHIICTGDQQKQKAFNELLLEFNEYWNVLNTPMSSGPIEYLYVKNFLTEELSGNEGLGVAVDYELWSLELFTLWKGYHSVETISKIMSMLLDSLSLEQCIQLLTKTSTIAPKILPALLVYCPDDKFHRLRTDCSIWMKKCLKGSSAARPDFYAYIATRYRERLVVFKKMHSTKILQSMPPFLVALYMLSPESRKVILSNFQQLDSEQLTAAAAAWPEGDFLTEFFSTEKQISLKQYELILKCCSVNNLKCYLDNIGRVAKGKYDEMLKESQEYQCDFDELFRKSLGDIKISRYLTARYFKVSRKLTYLLHGKKVPIMIERANALYRMEDRVFDSNCDFLLIQQIQVKAKELLQHLPKVPAFI